mgnify:CR=1 FL=1
MVVPVFALIRCTGRVGRPSSSGSQTGSRAASQIGGPAVEPLTTIRSHRDGGVRVRDIGPLAHAGLEFREVRRERRSEARDGIGFHAANSGFCRAREWSRIPGVPRLDAERDLGGSSAGVPPPARRCREPFASWNSG